MIKQCSWCNRVLHIKGDQATWALPEESIDEDTRVNYQNI